jgi:hypothetical protein
MSPQMVTPYNVQELSAFPQLSYWCFQFPIFPVRWFWVHWDATQAAGALILA